MRLNPDRLRIDRDQFFAALQERQIGASVHFIPVYHFNYYRERFGWQAQDFPQAEAIFDSAISLPCYPRMSDADVRRVIGAVEEIVESNRR